MKKGFTLVELLVVISIIALLASIIFASTSGIRKDAKIAKAESDIQAIKQAMFEYYRDNGHYPQAPDGWMLVDNRTNNLSEWDQYFVNVLAPYINPDVLHEFKYELNSNGDVITQGIFYWSNSSSTNPTYGTLFDGENWLGCLKIYNGYILDINVGSSNNVTRNDNGIDPDNPDIIEGDYYLDTTMTKNECIDTQNNYTYRGYWHSN